MPRLSMERKNQKIQPEYKQGTDLSVMQSDPRP